MRTLCAADYTDAEIRAWTANQDPSVVERSIQVEDMFVATYQGVVSGFGSQVESEIVALYVDPRWARYGVGHHILARLEARIIESGGSDITLSSTLTAQKFYASHGYRTMDRQRHVLTGGISVVVVSMLKTVNAITNS